MISKCSLSATAAVCPLIIYPTSFGRYFQNKDFGLVDSVAWYVDNGKATVYCPDAIDLDSFYNKAIHPADRMKTHNAYERAIVNDVFDIARRECHCHRVAVCGASLGAYHAGNVAFRHPDLVSHFISLSGSFDISDFFNGYHDDNIYFNSPYEYLPNITDPWKYNHMGIIIGTGEWDGITGATCCRSICRRLRSSLLSKCHVERSETSLTFSFVRILEESETIRDSSLRSE